MIYGGDSHSIDQAPDLGAGETIGTHKICLWSCGITRKVRRRATATKIPPFLYKNRMSGFCCCNLSAGR